jgi:NAD(P)-dependent dehydrogenase (short-subunit alcohol dehydrogenase family)
MFRTRQTALETVKFSGGNTMNMLAGKVAIVTGATSGIGRRTVERFVEEGARVVFCGRRAGLGVALEMALGSERCRFMQVDVTQESEVEALVAGCLEIWGRIDCLFNNAGGPAPQGGIESMPVEGFDAAMATLVRSVMLGMKHVAPIMVKQGAGSIINNGSVAAIRAGLSSSMAYSAAKAAVVHLSNCVAMQLGEKNVRVNCISPGAIATGIFAKAFGLKGEAADQTAETIKAGIAKAQPIPRAGITDDIANAAVFLASDQSTFINGHNLVVDGGMVGGRMWSVQQAALAGMRQAFGVDS